jgi:hypothetical protein
MKSGNKIVVRGLSDYNIKNQGNAVTAIELKRYRWWPFKSVGLLLSTIDLSQIEAVTRG